MAGFLNNSQVKSFTGFYGTHFNTFKRPITISKEPIRAISSTNRQNSPIFGYGEASNEINYSYTPVTGIFNVMVTYSPLDQKTVELEEVKNVIGRGKVRIKVEKDCRDFIEDGRKTEKIEFDNKTFKITLILY